VIIKVQRSSRHQEKQMHTALKESPKQRVLLGFLEPETIAPTLLQEWSDCNLTTLSLERVD